MLTKSLSALVRRVGRLRQLTYATVVGGLVAILVPALAVLLGSILASLVELQRTESAEVVAQRISPWLPDVHGLLSSELSPLARVTYLLVMALAVVLLMTWLLYFFYRLVQTAAIDFEVTLISELRDHAKKLATVRTLSAQQTALTDCLDYHLPRVRSNLSRWWRTFPRHAIQFIASVLIASLIQPMLSLLTLIATLLVVLVYRLLDRMRRTSLPVVRERAAQERQALVGLSLQGPLLESVHASEAIERRFAEQLIHYRKDAVRSLTSSAWKTPTLLAASSLLLAMFLFVIAVQLLRSETHFSVPGAFSFSLCVFAAGMSANRLQRTWRDIRTVDTAAEEVERFLSLPVEQFDSDHLKSIQRVSQQAELEHVTVQDSSGRKLLENVSITFKPNMLIGVLASQRLQAHALVELLMGFGRPVSGRMLVDGILVSDLKPQSLMSCAHWVASDGTLVAGSVRDNLLRNGQKIAEEELNGAVSGAKLVEVLQKLPDGLNTLISPGDDRLGGDAAFRIGIARALLTRASVLVVEEPSGHYETQVEQQSLAAIASLVSAKTITVVLPQRLMTLRQCDLVVMIHDHKVADIGKHADLLQRNELYRHLNYLRFNPFRSLPE